MPSGKYIVLDIDLTLVCTLDCPIGLSEMTSNVLESDGKDKDECEHLLSCTYRLNLDNPNSEYNYNDMGPEFGIYRPRLKEFLHYIIEEFEEIYVYSAGGIKYVNTLVDYIFSPYNYTPKVILSSNNCIEEDGLKKKDLELIYAKSRETGGNANETNTYILDDRDDIILQPDNHIHIPDFEVPEIKIDNDREKRETVNEFIKYVIHSNAKDDTFSSLIKFFESNKHCSDIRKLNKRNIFKNEWCAAR